MCGIFAWAGKVPTKFRKEKLDILGIHNEVRGTHSCGITLDGDIHIGIDGNKVYRDFLANVNYNLPVDYPSVIGHTRAATGGAHNIDNAHPFGYGTHNNGYRFVGVHNGSLHNHRDLAKTYGVEVNVKVDRKNYVTYRDKIDSEILLECIYRSNSFKVLSEYDGAAALIFTDLAKPNVTYFYHGKSKKYANTGEPVEERPLFYWQETRNSVYVSSIANSLVAIGAEDNVKAFEYNTVYKVTDGNIEKAEKIKISREKAIQTQRYTFSANTNNTNNTNTSTNSKKGKSSKNRNKQFECNFTDTTDCDVSGEQASTSSEHNIYNDTTLQSQNDYGNAVYVKKLRYWRNGHRINGCYTWVPGYGFFFLDEKSKEADKRFFDLVNKEFYASDFIKSRAEVPHSKHSEIRTPFLVQEEMRLLTLEYIIL